MIKIVYPNYKIITETIKLRFFKLNAYYKYGNLIYEYIYIHSWIEQNNLEYSIPSFLLIY